MVNTFGHVGWLCKLNLIAMFIFMFGQRGVHTFNITSRNACGSQIIVDPFTCGENGYFKLNPIPGKCEERTYCYIGPEKDCIEGDLTTQCVPGLKCNCGKCQKTVTLCPMMLRWPKRLQPNFSEYSI